MQELEAEAAVMIRMRHPNVVQASWGLLRCAASACRCPSAIQAATTRLSICHLLQFMGLCQVPPALVTEYCARGSLYSCLQAARADPAAAAELTWARRLAMVSSCACCRASVHIN